MLRCKITALVLLTVLLGVGCGFQLPSSLFSSGAPFILSGTAALADEDGPCLVWLGDNGETYHLFQSLGLDNETFDRITTPGTRSRLQLAERNDLTVTCQMGPIVDVQDVLEVVE